MFDAAGRKNSSTFSSDEGWTKVEKYKRKIKKYLLMIYWLESNIYIHMKIYNFSICLEAYKNIKLKILLHLI